MFGDGLIQPLEEGQAVFMIMLPCVLAVHDDGHNRRLHALRAVADAGQLVHEVRDRILGAPARVFEADHVRQAVIAEEHRNLAPFRPHQPGLVQVAPALMLAQIALQRMMQHRLAGRAPVEAGLGEQPDRGPGHRALGRPAAARSLAEHALVMRDREPDMLARARLAAGVGLGGQQRVRHRFARGMEVEH